MKTKMGKYLCEFAPDNPRATAEGYVYTHVLVAEQTLGRYLTKDECVHHIDTVKYNNEPSNLMVFKTKADHSAFHHGVEAVLDGDVWYCPDKRVNNKELCPVCKKNYKEAEAEMCIDCWKASQRVFVKDSDVQRPDRSVLKDKIKTTSFLKIGKEYNVSDSAIRKWCKYYGLPFRTHDIALLSDEDWENECFNSTK
jgi:hypothetical protein